jgi:hypothetical protein
MSAVHDIDAASLRRLKFIRGVCYFKWLGVGRLEGDRFLS